MNRWNNNDVQFPRLLCEIMANEEINLARIAASMDLSVDEVSELFDRANSVWEQAKAKPAQESHSGLFVSPDDGITWLPTGRVRVMFHDATESDDGMQNLIATISNEGVILDLVDQASGVCEKTAALPLDYLTTLAA